MSTVQIAEVQEILGTAYAVNADGERRLLQAGDALFDGESVETSEGGVVELVLSDGQPFVIAGQPVFLISADLITDLAPGADESVLQAETLDELLAEGRLESLEQIIESADEAEAESLDDLLAAAEEDPSASGIDFDNLAATAAGGDDSGADGGGSTIVQATRISASGDDTSATLTEGNTQAAPNTDAAGGNDNSISVAFDDAFAISEDTPSAGNLADNDALSGDVTFALLDQAGPSNGAVTLNEDGTFVFTPNTDFVGGDSFQYVITDANGQTSTATVSITVEAVNDAPVAVDDVVLAQEDVPLENINVLGNDSDSDGNPLTVTSAVSAAGGVVTINADGTLSYQAPANFTGADTINYTIADGAGGSSTAVVNIDVAPVSDLAAADDQNAGDQDTVISGSVAGNDTTSSGGSLTYAVESGTESGALIFNADGAYEYTPSSGFTGTDSFSYVVSDADSGESVTQTVILTVNALNIPPVVVNQAPIAQDDEAAVVQNVPLSNIKVLDNDEDPEGEALTVTAAEAASGALVSINADGTLNYTPNVDFLGADTVTYTIIDPDGATAQASLIVVVSEPQAQNALAGEPLDVYLEDTEDLRSLPAGATVTVASSQGSVVSISEDGVMSYQAPDGFTGEDVITYTTDDGQGNVVTRTVVVQVYPQSAPLVGIDDSVVTLEDVSLSNIAVLANDKIAEGSEVTVVSATSSFGAQVEINADGTLNYTPLQDFTGIDTVTYTARNGDGIESTATLSVEVTPENDPPVAVVDLVTTLEDTPLQNINVLGNDIDVDGDTLTVLEVGSAEGALVSVNDDGTVNYQPNANFNGVDTITYSVSDGVGGVTSGELKISVEAVNDAPVVTSEQVSVVQNQSLDAIAVLLNDEDPDGNSLSVEAVVASDGGTVEINEDGTLKYTPAQDYVGQETLTYTVIDGQGGRVDGQVTVSVASFDDGPVANEDSFSVDEDGQMLGMDVLGNDRVADGETLSVVSATSEQGATVVINDDGTLDYQAPANFHGIDVVTYRARDSQGRESQSTVTVTVNEVNDAPVALNDGVGAVEDTLLENINVLENDTDANNDTLTVTTAVSSAGGAVTINADGTLNYLPPANFTGEDTITYSISDGNDGTSTATVTVSVASINDTPLAFSANEGTSEEAVLNGAVPGATDVDGTIVSYTVVNDVAEGLLTLEVDGSYRFDPGSDFDDLADGESRDVTFTYTATDNEDQASAPATITITVTGTSDVPVASDATQNTDENTVLEATVAATSVDGVIASYAVASDLADEGQGSLTFNADGSYSFEPGDDFDDLADGESREVSFTYTATDNNGGVSAPATVTITVTGTNDTPVAIGASVETLEDTSIIELDVLSKVTDIDGDTITLVSVNSEAGGTITLNEGGTINYAPAENYFGSDTLTYVATDPSGGSVTGSIAIDIIAVNDAPVVVGETIVTEEDAAVDNIIVLANDSDIEGDALSVTEASSVNGGTVTINADGTLNYSPPANFNGTDTIEYAVTDAGGAASVGAVLVTVNPVDDQPIASTLGATTEKGVALEGDLNLSVEAGDAPLTFGLLPGAEPQHGVVALNDDGTFVYTPDEDFSGIERFGYTVTDEDGDQSFSVVTISVVADSFRANAESDLPDDVPVAASDIYAVDEDTQITGRVTQNDDLSTDGDGTNVVTVAESDGPTHGALTMSEAGVFVYTPDTNYFGADSFRYTLTDANGDTSSAVVTLNVGQVNDEAVFEGDVSGTMLEDGGLDRPLGEGAEVTPIIGALSVTDFLGGALEDTGPAGIDNLGTDNGFRIAVDAQYVQAQGGVAIIDADGNWAYTPNANFNGPDSFTVLVTDDLGNVESQVINVTVDAQADLSAADDVISVDEDGVLNASVADNDSTISGGALTYALAAGATVGNGELLFNEDGSYTYTPNTDYYGPDSFSYVVTDAASGESSTQAVSITVNPVVEDNAITIDRIEGDSGVAGDFQTNDTTLTVSGSLEKAIASDERVEISSDGGQTWTTVTVDGTNWSFDDPTAQDASFTFEARIAGPGDSVGATAEQAVTIDTTAPIATIELDSAITSDNVINAQESNSDVTVFGSVGGEARVGDTVTLTVNGVQSQASVESIEGALRFSVNIPGADLVADDDLTIDAAITTTDDAGNISEVATDVQTYAVDLEAFATITVEVLPDLEGVALENAIAVAAYRGDDLNVTGVTGLDAAEAGEITLTVNGKTYTGTVGEQGTYSIAVAAADLVDAGSAEGTTREITVTVEASDEAGNPATASAATDVLVRPVQQVQFTDNFVDGVRYTTTSGLSGTTGTNESTGEAGAQGSFLYRAGDTITLTLGSVIIAEFSADQVQGEVLFLQDIAGVALSDVNNDYVENMAIFLQTLDADANADNGIQITPETAAFFEGYTDSGTGEALNIATAGKQLLANALTAAANAVDDQGNSLNLLPADFEFSADSETDQDGPNDEGLLENTFETVALQHVADTIDVLGADRQTDLFAFDDRQSDAIDAGTGIIEYAYVTDGNTVSAMNFSAYAISERTGQPVGLLANATPQQVSLDNMIVENVRVGPEYAEIVESVVYDDVTKEGTITLVEGVTPEQLEGLYLTYRVKDWTAVTETTATAIDTYRSHLSTDADSVSEDAQYNQFTLTSALTFDTDQALTLKISPQSFGDNFAEYADDFLVPMEYSTDGGATWQVMDQVGTYTRDGYDLPLPLFGFTLPAGQDTLEVRISVFDDQTIEADEVIDLLIEGENFYPEVVQPGILDNETQATLPIVDIDYAVVSEGDGVAVLTVTLSEAADGDVTVDYTTGDLGATAGEDYQANSGTITIPQGQTSFQVEVSLIDDTVEEDTEFLVVNLSNVSANAVLADPQATVRILDNENNTAPSVVAVQANGEEDPASPIEVTLTGSDNDPYDAVSSFTLSGLPANGILYSDTALTTAVTAGAAYAATDESLTLYFVPDANWNGETTFGYKGSDGELESAEAVATIMVNAVNDAPVAVDDVATTNEDTVLTSTVDLDFNDTDLDGDALTVTAGTFATAQGGSLALASDGSYTYTPADNFNGTDTVDYTVTDGTLTDTGTLTITVNASNDAATFSGDTTGSTDEDAVANGTLTVTDTADGITPTDFTVASDGSNGTATIDASTGAWTYTPNANFNGTDSFTVTVTDDDGNTETQVIEVTVGQVQDVATFSGDTTGSTDEDAVANGTLTVTDTADGITPTDFTVASDGSNGTATIDASTGAWTYTPNANFNGTDSFTVTVTDDDGNTETQVIEVTVGQVQDVATFSGDTTGSTDEDAVANGTLTVTDTADGITPTDFTVASDGSNGTATIDASTGAWTYTPNANFNGTDSFTVTVTDDDGNTETQVIEVTVGQVQDVATFSGDTTGSTDEDAVANGTLTVTDTADGITPTDFTVASDGSNGTATIDASTGAWTYTPNANFNGTDSFTVTVTDDDGNTETQVIEVTVGQVQDVATFSGDTTGSTDEDAVANGTLTVTDTADGITPTDFTVASDGSNGTATIDASTGAWTYTPNANFNGTDSFTVTVTDDDGNTETQVIEVTVGQVQDVATFSGDTTGSTDEDAVANGTLTVTDTADGITPTDFTVASDGSNGTATIDASTGAWTYTPNANFNGTDSFTVTVTDDDGNTETQVIEVTVGQVQDVATFSGDTTGSTDEDAVANGTLTVTDTADGITPTDFTVASDGSNGTATIDASTGAWTYTPNANFNGTDSFTVTVTDDDGNTETQVIEVTVGQVQDVATFSGDTTGSTDEDAVANGTLTVTDTADGITPTDFTVASDGSNGTATIDASTGAWTYTPNANFNGTDSFTVTVTDDDGNTETQVIEVTVGQVQDVATFSGDTTGSTDEDAVANGTLTVTDTADGITPTDFTVASDGSNGTATIDASTGAWTYTPNANFNGTDSFTVTVTDDDGNTETQVIEVTVGQVQDVATFSGDTTGSTDEDAVANGTLTVTDTADGITPTDFTVASDGSNGTATIDASTGAWTYTPNANFNGTDSFTVTVTDDDGNTETQVIEVTVGQVQDVATFSGDTTGSTDEDAVANGTLTVTDTADGITPTDFTVASDGSNGTATIDASTGAWTYTPNANFNGTDSFTVTVTDDDGNTETQVIEVTVGQVQDVATFSGDTTGSTDEDAVANGTLTVTDTADGITPTDFTVASDGSNGTATIDASTGAWTYTPNANFNGTDSFTVTVTDDDGNTETQVIEVTVGQVQDVATFSGDTTGSTDEDAVANGTLTVTDTADGITPTDFTVASDGSNGTATIDASTGAWTYTPNANFNGTDSFTVTVTDDDGNTETQVIEVTVGQVQDVATFSGDTTGSTDEDAVANGTLTVTDTADGITPTDFTVASDGSNGTATIDASTGAWTYTPNANFNGTDSFTVTVTDDDGNTETQVIEVTVGQVQDVATFSGDTTGSTDEDAVANGTLTVTDTADGITPTDFTVASDGSNGTATIDASTGAWTYTPNANFNGTDSFTVTVTDDDGNTETQVIEVTVGQVQDVATFSGDTTGSTDEDAVANGTLTVTDTADGITPTDFTVASDGSNGTATIDASTGAWTYTPNANFNGTDSFTVTVTDDDGNTETQVIEVTVGQVQDVATFSGDTTGSTDEDAVANGTLTVTDTADGITPTDFTVASDGSNGTATIDASTGAWTYTPNANFNGTDSFTVTVTDDDGNTETQVIEVTVGQVQDVATFSGDTTGSTDEDAVANGTLTVTDTADGITPTDFTVASDGSNGTATIDASTGAWTYTPNANFNGTDSFTVTVTDDDGNTETQVIEVTVGQVQDVATFSGDTTGSTDEDAVANGTLTVTDTADGITPTDFTVASDGSNGTATIDASTGAWTYTPNANFNGTDSFTVTVTDDDGNTETQVIEVTVGQVQDVATFSGDTTGSTDEDAVANGTLTVTDTADGITPTDFTVASDGSNGTATIDASTGAWTYTPNANFNGTDSFTVTVTDDDGNTETQVIEVTVGQVQDVATFSGDTTGSTDEDAVANGTLTVTDTADGITPTDFTVASDGSNGTATIDASTGAWTYTPNANFNGTDSFTVTVTDDDGNTETQVIEVTVEPTDSVTSQSIVIDGSEINAVPSSTVVIGRNDADDDDDVIIDNLIGPDVVITDESGQHVKFKNGVVGTKGDGDLLTNGDSLRFSYYDDVDLSLTSDGKFANYSADSTSSTNNAQAELRVDGDSSARASLSITALAADGTTIAIDSVQVTYADGSSEVLTVADTNFSSNGSGVVTIAGLPDGVTIAVHGVSNYASLDFENESGTKFGFVYGTDAEDAKASDGSDDAVYAPDVGIGYVISTDGHKVKVKNGLIGVKDTGNIKDESIDPGENLTIDFQTGIETDRGDDGKLDSYTAGTDVAINHASFRLLAEGSTDITINLTDASNAAVSVAYVLVTHDGTTYRLTASNGAADPVVIGGQNVTFSESSGVVTLNNLPDDVTVQVAGDSDYSAIDLSNAGTGTNQFAIADIDTGSDSFATASGQFATLATGSFSDWTETGAVTSRAGEALTVNGEALSYVSEGEKLLAVTSSGVVAFEVSLQEVNGVTGYSVEMYRSLDPSFTDISSSNSVSPSNSASKTISFSNSSLQITVTATTNGQATTINGQNNPAKYGPGNDKEVNTNDALIFTASSSISGLDLSLFNFSGTDTLIWTAYDGATVVASGTVVPSDLSNSNLEINAGVPFTSLSITAGSGDFQIVDDGIVAQEVNETPLTIDLQATVDGNPANFSITFDQLAAGDTTMQAVDPDSLLLAGAGSETLIGLTGEADTFEWNLADGTTEGDTIQGFEEGSDVIDLSDLLTGYDPADPNNDDLADFIQVAYDSATGDTTIEVSSNGDGTINQVIKVEGVDLTDDVSLTGLSGNDSINAILSDMMTKGTLIDPDI